MNPAAAVSTLLLVSLCSYLSAGARTSERAADFSPRGATDYRHATTIPGSPRGLKPAARGGPRWDEIPISSRSRQESFPTVHGNRFATPAAREGVLAPADSDYAHPTTTPGSPRGLQAAARGVLQYSEETASEQPSSVDRPADTRSGRTPAILSAIPADALAVVTVRDLAEFDAKLVGMMGRLGLPVSPYMLMKGALEIVTGLDDHGSAAVVLMPPDPDRPLSRAMIVLLPTTDRTAMLTFLNPQPIDGGYVKVTLRGRETYAGTRGSFTVFGPDLETVRSVVAATRMLITRCSTHQLKRFAVNGVSVWINTASVASSPLVGRLAPWLAGWASAGGNPLARYEYVQCSARVESDGITLELYARMTGPSHDQGLETTTTLLQGLPDEPFVFAMGAAGGRDNRLAKSIVDPAIAGLVGTGIIHPERCADVAAAYESAVAKIGSVAASISLLPGAGDGYLGLAKVVEVYGEAALLSTRVETTISVLKSGVFVDPKINEIMERIDYRRAAETSAGVTIDHLMLDASNIEAIDEAALRGAVGEEGLLVRIGVVDRRLMVIALGGGLARFNEIVATARAKRAPLASDVGIQMSAMGVARKRAFEAYVSVDRLVSLFKKISRVRDAPAPALEFADINAPAALAVHAVGPGETQVDVFIPTELLIAVKNAMIVAAADKMTEGR